MGREICSTNFGIQTWMILSIISIFSVFLFATVESKDLGSPCTSGDDCSNVLSMCSIHKICECNDSYIHSKEDNKCMAVYNNYCTAYETGGGCIDPNAICKATGYTKRCQCKKDYSYDEDIMTCVGKGVLFKISVTAVVMGVVLSTILQ